MASAEPWPSWNNVNPDGFYVDMTYLPDGLGYDIYTYQITVTATTWDQFRDFVVYPVGLSGYTPPNTPGTSRSYGYAFDASGEWLLNDAGWYGGTDPKKYNKYLDGGFEVGPGKVPGYDGGALGWWAGPDGGGWQTAAGRTIVFQARLPTVAQQWDLSRFSMHVRPSWDPNNTNWRANGRNPSIPPVPEPGSLALLATGALGLLPLLRRRRTT
jgi:hypothetical protein